MSVKNSWNEKKVKGTKSRKVKCCACWTDFFLPKNYKGKRPKCSDCRKIAQKMNIDLNNDDDIDIPIIFELIQKIVHASVLDEETFWFDTILLICIGCHITEGQCQNDEDDGVNQNLREDVDVLIDCLDEVAFDDEDSDEDDSQLDNVDADTKVILRSNDASAENMNKLYTEIGSLLNDILLDVAEFPNFEFNVPVRKSNSLYDDFLKLCEIKNMFLQNISESENFFQELKNHADLLSQFNFHKVMYLIPDLLQKIKKKECTSGIAKTILNLLLISPTKHELSWFTNLIQYFCDKAKGIENAKAITIERGKNGLTIPAKSNSTYLAETCTQEIIANVVKDVPFEVTKAITYKEITKSVNETVDQQNIKSQPIKNLLLNRALSNQRQLEKIREKKNISSVEFDKRKRKATEIGRKLEIFIEEIKKTTIYP